MLYERVSILKCAGGLQYALTVLWPEERMDAPSQTTCHAYGKSHGEHCISIIMLLEMTE